VITLLISPFRRLAGIPDPIRFRRMVGLFGFFYGSLHLLIHPCLDKFFDWHDIWQDIGKRRFITVDYSHCSS